MKRVILNIGDVIVSREPAILETVLGSCVAVCLWSERLRIGGMNHFMLPKMEDRMKDPLYYGPESIQRLLNLFVKMGIPGSSLKAKVFGGGLVMKGFHERFDVGRENVLLAKEVLARQGVPIMNELTGKEYGIKVLFHSATGRALVKKIQEWE